MQDGVEGETVAFLVVKATKCSAGRFAACGLGCHFTYIESAEMKLVGGVRTRTVGRCNLTSCDMLMYAIGEPHCGRLCEERVESEV
jgi:hypothetical protein